MNNTIGANYSVAWKILMSKKWKLCGLILLESLLVVLAELFGIIPLISIPISLVINVSLAAICLKGVRGEEVDSKNLFDGFKNFKHNAGGMLWMWLWVYIWVLVPVLIFLYVLFTSFSDIVLAIEEDSAMIAAGGIIMMIISLAAIYVGMVFMIIKDCTYAFTPYILMEKPEIHPMDAIKESKKLTNGLKGRIFFATIIPSLIISFASMILTLFSFIPYIGVLFKIVLTVLQLAATVFTSIFINLTMASFYNNAVTPVAPAGAYAQYPMPGAAAYPGAPYAQGTPVPPAAPYVQGTPAPAPAPAPAPSAAPESAAAPYSFQG